jgi:hypothetical protein
MMRPSLRRALLVLGLIAGIGHTPGALELETLYVRQALEWIGNAYTRDADGNPVQGSEASPLLSFPGLGVGLRLSELLSLEPGLQIYAKDYIYIEAASKAVPTQIETGPAAGPVGSVVGFIVSPSFRFGWALGNGRDTSGNAEGSSSSTGVTAGFGATPNFLIRLVFPIEGSDVSPIRRYLFGSARFFRPSVSGFLDYRFSDRFGVGVELRSLIPVHHIWDGESLPFWDQMHVGGALRISLYPGAF